MILWKKQISRWTDHLWPLKSGPSKTPRRLVAVNDAVYVTLGLLGPVSKLDAATGKELKVYSGTEKTEEIILKDGVLYLVIHPSIDPAKRGGLWKKTPKTVMAVKESDGTILWKHEVSWIAPITLTIGEKNVYVCDGPRIIAFDCGSGKELWKSEPLPWRESKMPTYFAPTMVAVPGAVLYVGGENWHEHAGSKGLMTCLDAENLIVCKDKKAQLKPVDGKIGLEILVDRNSVEIFGNNGSMYMPIGEILPEDNKSIELFTKGGKTRVENVEVCELNSVWK